MTEYVYTKGIGWHVPAGEQLTITDCEGNLVVVQKRAPLVGDIVSWIWPHELTDRSFKEYVKDDLKGIDLQDWGRCNQDQLDYWASAECYVPAGCTQADRIWFVLIPQGQD